jgi:hypothetical protein
MSQRFRFTNGILAQIFPKPQVVPALATASAISTSA